MDNNSSVDIFSSTTPQNGEFFKFKNIGDQVQGTYIGVRNAIDQFGNPQTIYILTDTDGKVWNLGFRDTNVVINERMASVRFGQIVGFKFEEERDSKKQQGIKVKIIRVYADQKFVDHNWLEHQKQLSASYSRPAGVATNPNDFVDEDWDNDESFVAPTNAGASGQNLPLGTTTVSAPSNDGAIDAIRNLARLKGLTQEGMSVGDSDKLIEQYTELPLIEDNFTKIIIKLTSFTNK